MRFYTRLEPDPQLARGYVYLLDAIAAYRLKGRTADAERVRAILRRMWDDYDKLGARGAAKADELVKARLRATAVRPPTSGALEGAIFSRPLVSTFPAGAVGIVDLDALDAGAVNRRTGGIYWRAQEYGLPVDPNARPAPGYFEPGQSRPSAGQFRAHPYFAQQPYARGMPALVRTRPLEARHFLRDGAAAFATWHAQEDQRIQRSAITGLARI